MKLALPLLSCLVLSACAPALLSTGTDGRIVNVRSGQEGVINFLGGFRDRAIRSGEPDNVTVSLGGLLYSGKYTVLGRSGPRLGVGLGFGYGGFPNLGGDSLFGPSPYYDAGFYGAFQPYNDGQPTRPGNLIARAAGADGSVTTLTCDFQADRSQHGVGTCQDSAGATYTLQF